MGDINWGLAGQPNAFDNALAQGFKIGSVIRERKLEGEARDRETQGRNALAGYATSGQGFDQAVQYDPRAAFAVRGELRDDQRAQAEQAQSQAATMRKLLQQAKTNPQQAFAAAQQMGIDVSRIPPPDSPEFQPWVDQQLFIGAALDTPEGKEALSTAGKVAVDMGFKPGSPEFSAKVTEIWQQQGAIPYTDGNGATRLYIPGRNGVPAQQPISEGTVVENDAGEQMVLRGGRWESMPKGGAGASRVGSNFLDGL